MKKPFKVMATSTMIAAMAASTLVPTAVAQADDQVELNVTHVVFVSIEGPLAKIEMEVFNDALTADMINPQSATHIIASNGNVYPMDVYNDALVASGNVNKALELLVEKGTPIEEEVLPGKILKDKTVTSKTDEQPEDRLNETFFYNVA